MKVEAAKIASTFSNSAFCLPDPLSGPESGFLVVVALRRLQPLEKRTLALNPTISLVPNGPLWPVFEPWKVFF